MGRDMDMILLPIEIVSQTVLLVGQTGNGKSSTGNSIIGKSVFNSSMSFLGFRRTVDCQTAIFPGGKILHVIDTPGLFDFNVGSEFIKNEIMTCIEMTKDGIHAVILVISLEARFTEEEAAAIQSLRTFFGSSITDYMIVLFTGDDCLKNMSQEDYLRHRTPNELKEVLRMCNNRTVFFDNETDNEEKKALQLTKLLSLVDKVVEDNGRQPYTDSLFMDFNEVEMLQQQKETVSASKEHSKQELVELTEKIQSSYDEQLKIMTEMVELKLKEMNDRLEDQLAREKEARVNAERIAQEAKFKRETEKKMQKLTLKLAKSVKSVENSKNHEIKKLKFNLQHAKQMAHDAQHRQSSTSSARMGGDLDGICSLPSAEIVPRTVLLVGRTGNGKSSTGNSIIGKSVFKSEMSFSGVTTTLDCQTAIFPDGRALNVIDTPGLFDFHVGSEFIKKEIMKCIELAKDGIHAIILVLSLRTRFSEEEAAAVQSLSTFFGPTITDYMIVLFTGDDCLKKMSQEDYLQHKAPHELKEVLRMCKNRTVFFDNETDNEEKKTLQLTKLLSLVEKVVEDNGGQPYTDSLFMEFKEAAKLQQQKEAMSTSKEYPKQEQIELTEKIQSSYDEQLKRMTEMVELKLRERNQRLEEQLAHER